MAVKKKVPPKKTTTTTTVEQAEPELEREELDVFDRARLEFSGPEGAKLTIYRYDDGATSYLKRVAYDPELIDEEWIRKKFGPGNYQLRFQDPESPARQWSKVVSISPETSPSSAAPSSSGAESVYLETIRRQNEIMLQALLARATAPAGAPAAAGGSEALVALIQGMQSQSSELLRASLNRPDTSATILTVLERGMAFAADAKLESEGGWMAQFGRIAKDLLPAVQEILKARPMPPMGVAGAGHTGPPRNGAPAGALGPGGPGAVVDTNPGGGGAPSPSSSPSSSNPPGAPSPSSIGAGGLDVEQLIREFAPSILEGLQRGASPTAIADGILQYIPPTYYGEFERLEVETVLRAEPRLSQHREFVADLVRSLKDTGDGDDGDEAA